MNFQSLPRECRLKAEIAVSEAELVFLLPYKETEWHQSWHGHQNAWARQKNRALEYIKHVFFAVADAMIDSDMGTTEIRNDLTLLREALCEEVLKQKWPADHLNRFVSDILNAEFETASKAAIEDSDQWRILQQYLLDLAKWESSEEKSSTAGISSPVKAERSELYSKCKKACSARGVRLTYKSLAGEAHSGWTTETNVKWWVSDDPRTQPIHDRLIRGAIAKLMISAPNAN